MFPIGKVGHVLEGEGLKEYVLISDDTSDSGGYYILMCDSNTFNSPNVTIYDCWVEDEESLEEFFRDFKVRWET